MRWQRGSGNEGTCHRRPRLGRPRGLSPCIEGLPVPGSRDLLSRGALLDHLRHDGVGLLLLLLHGASNLFLCDCSLSLLNRMLLQLSMSLHLVEVHLSEQLLLMPHRHQLFAFLALLLDALQALHLLLDLPTLFVDVCLYLLTQPMLQLHLLSPVVVDFLHQRPTSKLFLLPLHVSLLPLAFRLFMLQAQQLLLTSCLPRHLQLQGLRKLHGLPLRLDLLRLLLLGNLPFALQNAMHKVLIEILFLSLLLCSLHLLDGHVFICLPPLFLCIDPGLDHRLLLVFLLLCPKLLQSISLHCLFLLIQFHSLLLHVELNSQSRLLLLIATMLQSLLPLLALDLCQISLMPELGIEVIDALLLCFAESFVVQLEIPICDGLQLHDLGVHRPKVIYACPPLLVELLLDDRLPLVLSALLKLIRAGRHSLHPLCRCLFSLDHLFLPSLHLIGQLLCKLIPAVLQLGLLLRLHI
mmetsp:Transcript_111409/g.265803  ORF Transcript_111409/g.265803 Transcript_111409/m.265803 type:complete len:466 (+) Transcript_111409:53-1450(+)